MSDRDDKIVSLDQRRRQDAARQKAEIEARARRTSNGSGRAINQPFGRPLPKRAANDGGATPIASGIGLALSWLTWGSLVVMGALTLWTRFGSTLQGP